MKRTFKKAISLLAAGTMLVSVFGGVAALATGELYTTHLWETMEDANPASLSSKTSYASVDGKYGNGAKYTYSEYVSTNAYAQIDFALSDTITIAEALEDDLTVEVEFDFYGANLPTDDNYFYLASGEKSTSNYAAGFSMKKNGQTKALKYNGSSNVDVKGQYLSTFGEFHTFKLVFHAEKAGYTNPVTQTATTADGWVLDGFYFDGVEQKSQAKYTLGGYTGSGDFTNLFFRFKSDESNAGEIGIDNVYVTSYTTPSDGVSPVPSRHTYMDKVLTYKDTASTGAYNAAISLFEQDYITTDDINDVYYMLEGTLQYVIDDIGKGAGTVVITNNDTVGGTPILVVTVDQDGDMLLDDVKILKLENLNSGSNTVTVGGYDSDTKDVKAFIFSSFKTLMPLAVAKDE